LVKIHTLISLVGKQPMPVLIPILQFKPEKNFLIPTLETEEQANNICKAIEFYNERAPLQEKIYLPVSPGLVNPYSAEEVHYEIKSVVEQCRQEGSNIVLNITGGTSIMTLGAFRVAEEVNYR